MKPLPTFSFPDSSELHKIRTDKVADKHSRKTDTSQDQVTGPLLLHFGQLITSVSGEIKLGHFLYHSQVAAFIEIKLTYLNRTLKRLVLYSPICLCQFENNAKR